MFTRVIIGGSGSELDMSAPTWSDGVYKNRVTTGSTGENGKHGFNGPTGKNIGFRGRGYAVKISYDFTA